MSRGQKPPKVAYCTFTLEELQLRCHPDQWEALLEDLAKWPMRGNEIDVLFTSTAWRIQCFDMDGISHGFLWGEDPTEALGPAED